MVSLSTTIKSGFITDLIIPPPGTKSLTTTQLTQISLDVALSILHDFEAFIRSSPLVTNVVQIHPGHHKYIDVAAFCREFGVELHPEYVVGNGEWVQYEITDKLSILYAFSTDLIYHTAMRRTQSGFESVTSPGNGVRIHGKFDVVIAEQTHAGDNGAKGEPRRVQAEPRGHGIAEQTSPPREPARRNESQQAGNGDDEDGVLNFIEHNETRCNVFLAQYIKATTGSSHRAMHERFKEKWNEEMKRRLNAQR